MCTRSNTTVLCEPIVFEDSKVWAIHKTKIDDRIENLRRRLSAFKVTCTLPISLSDRLPVLLLNRPPISFIKYDHIVSSKV